MRQRTATGACRSPLPARRPPPPCRAPRAHGPARTPRRPRATPTRRTASRARRATPPGPVTPRTSRRRTDAGRVEAHSASATASPPSEQSCAERQQPARRPVEQQHCSARSCSDRAPAERRATSTVDALAGTRCRQARRACRRGARCQRSRKRKRLADDASTRPRSGRRRRCTGVG